MAINWDDKDILLMGSQLGKQLRHYKKGDVDEVTLNKLAIWFMDNYDDLYDIYRQSGDLLRFMDSNEDTDDYFIEMNDNRPSFKAYEKSLEFLLPFEFYEKNNYGQKSETFDAFIEKYPDKWVDILHGMTRFHNRVTNIFASGLWVKPNPLAQQLWSFRTMLLLTFAMIRFAIWYYPTLYLKVSNERITDYWSRTYRQFISNFVEDWLEGILVDFGTLTDDYVEDWKDAERRELYRQWGVDPRLLQEQRAFINSLSLLIRRGLSDRDRKATTFQDERYNTANELKALAQLGWSPELPPDIDVEECPKCDGQGYRSTVLSYQSHPTMQSRNKKRKCTNCQGWGHIGEHLWLYPKGYNTGRHSRNPEIRSWDVRNENKRRRFDRLVSTFKSECAGNYK